MLNNLKITRRKKEKYWNSRSLFFYCVTYVSCPLSPSPPPTHYHQGCNLSTKSFSSILKRKTVFRWRTRNIDATPVAAWKPPTRRPILEFDYRSRRRRRRRKKEGGENKNKRNKEEEEEEDRYRISEYVKNVSLTPGPHYAQLHTCLPCLASWIANYVRIVCMYDACMFTFFPSEEGEMLYAPWGNYGLTRALEWSKLLPANTLNILCFLWPSGFFWNQSSPRHLALDTTSRRRPLPPRFLMSPYIPCTHYDDIHREFRDYCNF